MREIRGVCFACASGSGVVIDLIAASDEEERRWLTAASPRSSGPSMPV